MHDVGEKKEGKHTCLRQLSPRGSFANSADGKRLSFLGVLASFPARSIWNANEYLDAAAAGNARGNRASCYTDAEQVVRNSFGQARRCRLTLHFYATCGECVFEIVK